MDLRAIENRTIIVRVDPSETLDQFLRCFSIKLAVMSIPSRDDTFGQTDHMRVLQGTIFFCKEKEEIIPRGM